MCGVGQIQHDCGDDGISHARRNECHLLRSTPTLPVNSGTRELLLLQPYEHEGKDKDRGSAHVNLLDVPINHGRASRPIRGRLHS
jgi:hypothetical protein